MTPQRLQIFREIYKSSDHPDAESVYQAVRQKLPMVSLDTVYRTLRLYVELGLIETLGIQQEKMRFDGNAHPHHHFFCRECGVVTDIENDAFEGLRTPDEVNNIGRPEKVHVQVKGVCRNCLNRKAAEKTESLE